VNRRWLRLYPFVWRARYEDEMAQLIADVPLGPRPVVDLIRGSLDAWLSRELGHLGPSDRGPARPGSSAPETRRPSALWLSSLATATGLVSICLTLLRAVAVPGMVSVGAASSWWWIPVVARILFGGLILLIGLELVRHRHWWSAAAAIACGTGISILGAQWETTGTVSPHLVAQGAAGLHLYLTWWGWIADYWPLQFLLSVVAISCCVVAGGMAATGRRVTVPNA